MNVTCLSTFNYLLTY